MPLRAGLPATSIMRTVVSLSRLAAWIERRSDGHRGGAMQRGRASEPAGELLSAANQAAGSDAAAPRRVSLGRLLSVLLMIGALSFGRGSMALLSQEFMRRRGWLTPEEFAEG